MATARRESDNSGCSSWIVVVVAINALSRGLQSREVRENAPAILLAILGVVVLFAALRALWRTVRSYTTGLRAGARWDRRPISDPRDSPMYDRDLDAWPR